MLRPPRRRNHTMLNYSESIRFIYLVFEDKYEQSQIIKTEITIKVTHITTGVATFNFSSTIKGKDAAKRIKNDKVDSSPGIGKIHCPARPFNRFWHNQARFFFAVVNCIPVPIIPVFPKFF